MNCSSCGFENPAGMKFCGNCAKSLRLPQACPSCGFENPPGFKFCGECATPLAPPAQFIRIEWQPKYSAMSIHLL